MGWGSIASVCFTNPKHRVSHEVPFVPLSPNCHTSEKLVLTCHRSFEGRIRRWPFQTNTSPWAAVTHIHFRCRQLQGCGMCLNCVASPYNSGNEFTLSVTSIVFTRFREPPARCGVHRSGRGLCTREALHTLTNVPAPLSLTLAFITPVTWESMPHPSCAGSLWM